ncbi:phosphotriesterase family protein [Agrococcus lahaulensis]|uniref:phosphotriesterase family protein n=1 Tax=Agrococcus lahaulensis TaxID=341722 RepID=UPI0004794774|nr:aryldialkylphosphatase [Agrococcus lahaulensis]
MACVRTVLGDVDAASLGAVDAHEHLFQVSPLLPGDELDDRERSEAEARALRGSGFAAMLDATPIGLGRRPQDVAAISAATGLAVVASTGIHREAHYPEGHPLRDLDVGARAERFLADLRDGMPVRDEPGAPAARHDGAPVRAGVVKTGIGYWSISAFERATLEAAAIAHAATGAALVVHLEHGTAAHEVLDELERAGVRAERVLLAHADRLLDPGFHASLIERGVTLGYDGMARWREHSDHELLELTAAVVDRGHDRIALGGDVARASRYVAYGGMPGLAYLGDRYLPRLRERVGDEVVERMLVDHPRALLALSA